MSALGALGKIAGKAAGLGKGVGKIGAVGAAGGLAGSIFGGGGSAPTQSQPERATNNLGSIGRMASNKFSGASSNIAAVASTAVVKKVSVSDHTPTKQLWTMMFDILSSIDASMKNQLNIQRAVATKDSREVRENSLEARPQQDAIQTQQGQATGNSSVGSTTGILGLLAAALGAGYMYNKFAPDQKGGQGGPGGQEKGGSGWLSTALGVASAGYLGAEAGIAAKNTMKGRPFGPDGAKTQFTSAELDKLKAKGYTPRGNGFANAAGKFVSDAEIIKAAGLDKGTMIATAKRLSKPLSKVAGLAVAFEALEYALTGKKRSSANLLESGFGIIGGILGGAAGGTVGTMAGPAGTVGGAVAGGVGGDWLGRKIAKEIASMLRLDGAKVTGPSMGSNIKAASWGFLTGGGLPGAINAVANNYARFNGKLAGGAGQAMKTSGNSKERQQQVYNAFKNAGFGHAAALSLSAEVGRENNFNDKFLFGTHKDASNSKTNAGIFSFQGSRKQDLLDYLGSKGLYKNGKIVPGQASLDAQAEFVRKEMAKYKTSNGQRMDSFFMQKNVDPERAAFELGREKGGYIAWDMDGSRSGLNPAVHNNNRRNWYKTVAKNVQGNMAKPRAGGTGAAGAAMAMNSLMLDTMNSHKVQSSPEVQMADADPEGMPEPKIAYLDKDPRKMELFKSKDWRRKDSSKNRSQEIAMKDEKPQPVVVMKNEKQNSKEKIQMPRQAAMVPNPSAQRSAMDYHVYFNTRAA